MGTVCSPDVDEKKGNTARRRGASVRDTEYAESISESDSDYAESDGGPSHTPQPSRDEIDRERAIQGFINAFKNANHSLVMHLVDDYHELNLMSHIFENGDDCLRCVHPMSCGWLRTETDIEIMHCKDSLYDSRVMIWSYSVSRKVSMLSNLVTTYSTTHSISKHVQSAFNSIFLYFQVNAQNTKTGETALQYDGHSLFLSISSL